MTAHYSLAALRRLNRHILEMHAEAISLKPDVYSLKVTDPSFDSTSLTQKFRFKETMLNVQAFDAHEQINALLKCLTNKERRSYANVHLRALYEIWVGMHFLFAQRSKMFGYLMLLEMIEQESKEWRWLYYCLGSEDVHKYYIKKEAYRIALLKYIDVHFPAWPMQLKIEGIPKRPGKTTLKEKTIIIDFYNAKFKSRKRYKSAYRIEYETIYPSLSSAVHRAGLSDRLIIKENGNYPRLKLASSHTADAYQVLAYSWQYDIACLMRQHLMLEKTRKLPPRIVKDIQKYQPNGWEESNVLIPDSYPIFE